MRAVKCYSLVEAKLAKNKTALDLKVEGTVLEEQFRLRNGYLLIWLTDDSPYDEGLHIYLIDERDNIVDALEASVDFAPGVLKIRNIKENWLCTGQKTFLSYVINR